MNIVKFKKLKKQKIVKIGEEYFIDTPGVGSSIIINGKYYYEIELAKLKKLGYVVEKKPNGIKSVLTTKQLIAA
jgi:hypothetical protein